MSTTEFAFSDLVRHPTVVAEAAETHRAVVLHRRGAPDLELARADARRSELSQAEAFARLLAGFLPYVAPEDLPVVVAGVLPWTKHLTGQGRARFVQGLPAVIEDCADLGTLAPLDTYLAEWRDTAAVYADPDLRERLTAPIEHPLNEAVPAP